MKLLKNFLLVVLFIVGGIGIGVGTFVAQNYQGAQSKNSSEEKTSKTDESSKKAAASVPQYTHGATSVSFALPEKTLVLEEVAPIQSETPVYQLTFTQKISEQQLKPLQSVIYFFKKGALNVSAYSGLKRKVSNTALAGYRLNPSFVSGINSSEVSNRQYTKDRKTHNVFEIEKDGVYYLLDTVQGDSAALSDQQVVALIESISPTSTASTSTGSGLLLDSPIIYQ